MVAGKHTNDTAKSLYRGWKWYGPSDDDNNGDVTAAKALSEYNNKKTYEKAIREIRNKNTCVSIIKK